MRWVGSSVGGLLHNQGINVAFASCVEHCLQTTKISPKYPQDTQAGNQAIYIWYDIFFVKRLHRDLQKELLKKIFQHFNSPSNVGLKIEQKADVSGLVGGGNNYSIRARCCQKYEPAAVYFLRMVAQTAVECNQKHTCALSSP